MNLTNYHLSADGTKAGYTILFLVLVVLTLDPDVLLWVLDETVISSALHPLTSDADDSTQLDLAAKFWVAYCDYLTLQFLRSNIRRSPQEFAFSL